MSEHNSTLILQDSCLVKDEIDKCPDSIKLDFIKEEMNTYQINEDNNQAYNIEESIVSKSNNITLESSNIEDINVLDIKTEKEYSNTDIQNSILLKKEIDIKEEIIYLTDDDNNENVALKDENNSFPITNSSLSCSTYDENTTFQNNYDNNPSYHNKKSITNINVHTGEIPYKCDFCLKSFTFKRNLKFHILVQHTTEKPYNCKICGKSFVLIETLDNHMLTHTVKKPYKCDFCLKSFSLNRNLQYHILTQHTAGKPYNCKICQISFAQKQNFNDHMLTHTGKKPYKCDICLKSFKLKSNLKNHILTHIGKKPYKCDFCQKLFIQKGHLEIHILT